MPTPYHRLQQYALAISVVSVLYCTAEGVVSIVFGAEASSRALVFFGIQSAIEVASALIVLWRFRKIAKHGEERSTDASDLRIEKIGTYAIGTLIAILALAAEASAIAALVMHTEPDSSDASLIISASALVCMVLLWLPKRWLARALNSSTMAGEATCSLSCIQITVVLFAGALIFRLWHGGWWVDSATTIALGLLFAREAYKMLKWVSSSEFNGGCCGDHHHDEDTPKSKLGWATKFLPSKDAKSTSVTPSVGSSRADNDAKLELGELQRVLCACCYEKDILRKADSSQSDTVSVSTDSTPCCKTELADGEKCCSCVEIASTLPARNATGTASLSIPREPAPAYVKSADSCCAVPKVTRQAEAPKPVTTNQINPSEACPKDGDKEANHGCCK